MSFIKKALAVMLVLIFVFALAACGGEESNNDTTTTTAAAGESTTQGTNADSSTVTDKTGASAAVTKTTKRSNTGKGTEAPPVASITGADIDQLISRTTNVMGNASKKFIKSLKGFELNILYPWDTYKADSKLGQSAAFVRQQVEKEFGAEINEEGFFNNYNEQLATMLASRDCTSQVYMVQNFNFCPWFKNKYLCDLTKAMKDSAVDFKDPWYVQDATQFLNIDFKQYGWISFDAEYVVPYCIVYNKDLIKRAKLNDPAALAKNGQWTWAMLEKYAKKLNSSKIVGFGAVDTVSMLASIVHQKGGSLVNVKRGSEPKSNITNQTVKNALNTLADWCGTGKFCDTFKGKGWTYGKTQFANGKVAMIFGFHDTIQSIKHLKADTSKFALAPFPTEKGTTSYTNVAIPQFINFIPTQFLASSAKILFLRNEMYRWNYRFVNRDFPIQWKSYFSSQSVLNDALNIKFAKNGNKTVFSWTSICESGKTTTGTVLGYVIDNDGGVQTAIDKYKNGLYASYSDVWKGHKITGRV